MVVPIFELVCKPFLKGAYSGGSILDEAAVHIVDGEALRWLGCEPRRRFTESPVHIVGGCSLRVAGRGRVFDDGPRILSPSWLGEAGDGGRSRRSTGTAWR